MDDALHVIQVRGDTGSYLQLPPGDPTTDLTRLVQAWPAGAAAGRDSQSQA